MCCTGGYTCCGGACTLSCGIMTTSLTMSVSDCYCATFNWSFNKDQTTLPQFLCTKLQCNGTTIGICAYGSKTAISCGGSWGSFVVKKNDVFCGIVSAATDVSLDASSFASVGISNISSISGCFCLGTSPLYDTALIAET